MLETSGLVDVADPQQSDLSWRRLAEQTTQKLTNSLMACRRGELRDGQAAFIWRLRMIAAIRALYSKVQLPRSHPDHVASTDWAVAVKQFAGVGRTHAAAIVQRRLAEPFQLREIIVRVSEMERMADERHRPMEYPTIAKMLGWFPDPNASPRQRKPPRVTALEAQIEELDGTIEALHAEIGDHRRQEHLLAVMIVAQQIEIDRLRGFVGDEKSRPKSGLDMKALEKAWAAELRRREGTSVS